MLRRTSDTTSDEHLILDITGARTLTQTQTSSSKIVTFLVEMCTQMCCTGSNKFHLH